MGQFILNGRNYSGITYANGCFIDTDNVIKSKTLFYGSMSYTATEDCYVGIYLVGVAGSDVSIKINNVSITGFYYNAILGDGMLYPLKKGQTLSISGAATQYDSNYIVYGIQEGSPVTFLSEYASACYDTTEREVGCWVDGKPLYKRTWDFSASPIIIPYNDWVDTGIPASANIEKIISAESQYGSLANMGIEIGTGAGGFVVGANRYENTGNTRGLAYLTLLYTKTTDVAGSGKLTPTAMPTVHYDDTERIIGTWFGETLYQKTVVYNNPTLGRVDDLPHNIANIDTITNVEWVALESSGSAIVGHENNDSNWWADFFVVNRTGVSYRIGGSWGVTKIVVTIQYTKTT